MIEVRNLKKVFLVEGNEVEALKGISFKIEKGDIYGIIGMSGAGKSTLVRSLNYLEVPTSGEVLIDGKELGSLTEKQLRKQRSEIGMIFQHFNLLMQKNVVDNICFPLLLQGIKKGEAKKRAMELLEIVGLEDKARAYPAQLSGGQKQRVAIARALAPNPKILLCDEATSALDPQTTSSILQLLKEINKKMEITIVLITHQMSVVREICSHVAILEKGRLVEEGRLEDIFNHPKTPQARALIMDGDGKTELRRDRKLRKEMVEDKKLRIVFSENSAFEPVISNMVLKFNTPINILKADTKNLNGIAKGEMILGLPKDEVLQEEIKKYLLQRGLEIEEVTENVGC